MRGESAVSKVPKVTVVVVLAFVAITFAGNFLWIRIVVHALPPLYMQFVRFAFAGSILFAGALIRARAPWPTGRQWLRAASAGLFLVAIGQGCVSWAEQFVGAGFTVLMTSTIPIWVAIFGALFFRERIGGLAILGIAIGFVGLLPIVFAHGAVTVTIPALQALFGAATAWAVGSLYTSRVRIHPDGFVATGMQLLCGAAMLGVATFATGEFGAVTVRSFAPSVIAGLAYLIVVGGIVAYSAYVWLLRNARPAVASTFVYIQAIVGVTLGALVLHEPVPPGVLLGGIAVIAGVACVVASRR